MLFKRPGNPEIEAITKSCKKRSYALSHLKVIKLPELDLKGKNIRLCAWCALTILKRSSQKYCSKECRYSARSWAYPQKEENIFFLFNRQDWKCNVCQYDYISLIEQLLVNGRVYNKPGDFRQVFSYYLIRRIKSKGLKERKPEVDHIVPISKGGTSLGNENHQVICFTCHKAKSKLDNSGPRKTKLT